MKRVGAGLKPAPTRFLPSQERWVVSVEMNRAGSYKHPARLFVKVGGFEARPYSKNFLKTRQAFWPPKPKALDRATFT